MSDMGRIWRRRAWVVALALGSAAVVLALAALYFSEPILCREGRPQTGDALVVLGGDKTYRPERALEVFHQCAPAFIVISGDGDGDEVRRYLEAKGVPPAAIQLEAMSRNTRQNAELSVKLLRDRHVRRAVLVTSWFHSRRALNCFRHFAPEIQFVAAPTVADRPSAHWPNRTERAWVLLEYLKLAYYWPRYGICPL